MQQLLFKSSQLIEIEQPPNNAVIDDLEEETVEAVVELMARAMLAVARGAEEESDER